MEGGLPSITADPKISKGVISPARARRVWIRLLRSLRRATQEGAQTACSRLEQPHPGSPLRATPGPGARTRRGSSTALRTLDRQGAAWSDGTPRSVPGTAKGQSTRWTNSDILGSPTSTTHRFQTDVDDLGRGALFLKIKVSAFDSALGHHRIEAALEHPPAHDPV